MVKVPPTGSNRLTGFITKMTKNDALAPIIALEATVVSGRTWQAYKRGKGDEARERFLEEISGSIVWLGGVRAFNALGDSIIKKVLKNSKASFDVGTDKVLRTPFDNFMKKAAPKNFTEKQIALMKGAKVVSSVLLANLLIGFVVPHINHALTDMMRHNKKQSLDNKQNNPVNNTVENASSPTFKGGIRALNAFTNAIENTNTGKLLSTDAGTVSGRMYNARTKEERREIAFRDIASIYFYMWAQGHVGNVLNFITTGKTTRLNPTSAETLNKHLAEFLAKNGGEMNVEEFRKQVLGKNPSEIKLPDGIKYDSKDLSGFDKFMNRFKKVKSEPLQVAKVSELEKLITDKELLERVREMAKIQPERLGEAVISKDQLVDAYNKAVINDAKFLNKAFNEFTGGASNEEFRYISDKSLRNLKGEMTDYIERLCKDAKGGKITKAYLDKVKNKNITYTGINFVAGFIVAATFLSTIIPKIQYYITRRTTGVDAFPGTYDYEHHQEKVA